MGRGLALVLAIGAAAPAPARAQVAGAGREAGHGREEGVPIAGLVLEVHQGVRPDDAGELVRPILAELEARGFAAGPARVSDIIESRASRRGMRDDLSLDTLRADINAGYQKFLAGDFEAARSQLEAALAVIHQNPAAIALDQTMQPAHQRALIGLALSLRRLGREGEAGQIMAELIRTFPAAEISARDYGPEPSQLFRAATARLKATGTGRMVVESSAAGDIIFVNESFRGVARLDVTVPAGPYRVYLQHGKEVGRVYDLAVESGRTSRLVVDAGLDLAIRTGARWTGLLLPDTADRDEQAIAYAARLGRAVGVDAVVLVGVKRRGREPELVGTVVATAGRRVVRQASLALRPPAPETSRAALGRFLAGEDPAAELDVSVLESPAGGRPTPRSRFPWKWAATTGAVAVAATGVVLLQLDGTCRGDPPAGGGECMRLWDTAALGWITVGAGAALAATAGYLFWRDARRRDPAPTVGLVPAPGGLHIFATLAF